LATNAGVALLVRTGNFQGTDEQGIAAGAFRVCDDVWAAVATIAELETRE
jgi:hypothetical protein